MVDRFFVDVLWMNRRKTTNAFVGLPIAPSSLHENSSIDLPFRELMVYLLAFYDLGYFAQYVVQKDVSFCLKSSISRLHYCFQEISQRLPCPPRKNMIISSKFSAAFSPNNRWGEVILLQLSSVLPCVSLRCRFKLSFREKNFPFPDILQYLRSVTEQ